MKLSKTISYCVALGYFSASFLVTLYPFFQRQRRIVRIHAETVDHLAGYRLWFFLMRTLSHSSSSLYAEPVHQLLILSLMDMPVQHVSQWCSIRPASELAVITENRIMHQNDFALVVMDFRVILDPYKPGSVKILVF